MAGRYWYLIEAVDFLLDTRCTWSCGPRHQLQVNGCQWMSHIPMIKTYQDTENVWHVLTASFFLGDSGQVVSNITFILFLQFGPGAFPLVFAAQKRPEASACECFFCFFLLAFFQFDLQYINHNHHTVKNKPPDAWWNKPPNQLIRCLNYFQPKQTTNQMLIPWRLPSVFFRIVRSSTQASHWAGSDHQWPGRHGERYGIREIQTAWGLLDMIWS